MLPLHEYPYTDFHEINLDYIMRLARESMGLHLTVENDNLQLVNACGHNISDVTISYAEKALKDTRGNNIDAYVLTTGTDASHLILTHGDGTVDTITIPFATKAEKDVNGRDLVTYAQRIDVVGDKLDVVFGNGEVYEITVPYAIKASTDEDGKNITTYAATLAAVGNKIVLSDAKGRVLNEVTVPYAVIASKDDDGDLIVDTYGTTLTTGTTTVQLRSKGNTVLAEITVPYATTALQDTDGNLFLSDYAETLVIDGDGKRLGLEAHDGTRLSTVTPPFASLATDATNAVESVTIVGDQMIFTTYGGQSFTITCPYAVKAQKDDLGNTIKTTYVANVVNDTETGEISFLDATGNEIVSLLPTVNKATHDSYNNLIADYVKAIVNTTGSNYLTVTHGTGTVDSITIHYAETAWKDTNDNVIKNTYITSMECIEDVEDGHYKLVAYDGDTPKAELFRIELLAYAAQCDVNGRKLTTYVGTVQVDPDDSTKLLVLDGEGNEVNSISGTVSTTPSGSVSASASGTAVTLTSGTLPSVSYNAGTQTLTFNPGAFPTVASVTDPTISASFTGNAATENVELTENI